MSQLQELCYAADSLRSHSSWGGMTDQQHREYARIKRIARYIVDTAFLDDPDHWKMFLHLFQSHFPT